MSLAHLFPANLTQQSAIRQLIPGAVVKMLQEMNDGTTKEKWFVVIEVNASTVTCIINTNIPKLYASKPSMLACQIPLAPATHPFIHHDSHLDCSKVMPFPTANAIAQLSEKPEWFMGTADAKLLGDMILALNKAPTLNRRDAARYTSTLSQLISAASAQTNGSTIIPLAQQSNSVGPPPILPSGGLATDVASKKTA